MLGSALATVTRYVALKTWVFAHRRRATAHPAPLARDRGAS